MLLELTQDTYSYLRVALLPIISRITLGIPIAVQNTDT